MSQIVNWQVSFLINRQVSVLIRGLGSVDYQEVNACSLGLNINVLIRDDQTDFLSGI